MTANKGRHGPYIPLAPFREWCQHELERDNLEPIRPVPTGATGSILRLADRLGIHVRILNRIIRGMRSGARNGRKGEYPTTIIGRPFVEDCLTHAGIDFYDIYPDFAYERDIDLEPDAWCRCCADYVTPINSICPWCEYHMEDPVEQWAA